MYALTAVTPTSREMITLTSKSSSESTLRWSYDPSHLPTYRPPPLLSSCVIHNYFLQCLLPSCSLSYPPSILPSFEMATVALVQHATTNYPAQIYVFVGLVSWLLPSLVYMSFHKYAVACLCQPFCVACLKLLDLVRFIFFESFFKEDNIIFISCSSPRTWKRLFSSCLRTCFVYASFNLSDSISPPLFCPVFHIQVLLCTVYPVKTGSCSVFTLCFHFFH